MKRINLSRSQDSKTRFKMYKSGKQWVFSGLTLLGGLLGSQLLDSGSASADTVNADNAGTTKENTADTLVTKTTATIPADKVSTADAQSLSDSQSLSQSLSLSSSTSLSTSTQSSISLQDSVSLRTSTSLQDSTSASLSSSSSSTVKDSLSTKTSNQVNGESTSSNIISSNSSTDITVENKNNSTSTSMNVVRDNVSNNDSVEKKTEFSSESNINNDNLKGSTVATNNATSETTLANNTSQAPSTVTSSQLSELQDKLPDNSQLTLDTSANELNVSLPTTALFTKTVANDVKNFADQNGLVANISTLDTQNLAATENTLNVQSNPDSGRANFSESVSTNDTTSTSPTSVNVAAPDQVTNDSTYHQAAIANGTVRDVSNYAQLQTAWANSSVTYINITNDFNITTGTLANRANGASVIINGNNHAIDIGGQTFTYAAATTQTNFTLSNITVKQGFLWNDGNGYSLISSLAATQLTANINNVTLTKSDVNGYNPIHVMYGIGSKINFSGTNTFNLSNEVTRSVGSINFANNASVTLNRTSNDIHFSEFYFETTAPVGSVGYGNTLTMGDGSSNAAYTYNGVSAGFPAVYLLINGITAGDNVSWTQTGFQYFINGTQLANSSAQYTFGQNFTLNAPSTTQAGAISLLGTQKATFNAGTVFNIHQRAIGGIFQVGGSSSIKFISPKSLYLNTEDSSGNPSNTWSGIFTGTGSITMNNSSIKTWSNSNTSTTKPSGDANAAFVSLNYSNGTTKLTDVSGNSTTSTVVSSTTRELQTTAIDNGKINIEYVDRNGNVISTVPFDVSDKTKYNIGQTINLVTSDWASTHMPTNYKWALTNQVYPGAVSDAQSGGDPTSSNDNGDSYGQATYAIVPISGDTYTYKIYVYGLSETVQYQYVDQNGNVLDTSSVTTANDEYGNGLPTANYGNTIDWTNGYYTVTNVPAGYTYDTSKTQPTSTLVSTNNDLITIFVTASVQQVDVTVQNTDSTSINGSSSITVTVNGFSNQTKTLGELLSDSGVSENGYHLAPALAQQIFTFDATKNGASTTDSDKQAVIISLTPDYQQAVVISTSQPTNNPVTNEAYEQIPTSSSSASATKYSSDGYSNGEISFGVSDSDLVRQGFTYTVLGADGNTYSSLALALAAFKKFDTTTNGNATTDKDPQLYRVNYSPDPVSESVSTSASISVSTSAR
ncbi:KxYKxGKxW signal peptide domain-containing protein, partial [Leuconostoc litchii]